MYIEKVSAVCDGIGSALAHKFSKNADDIVILNAVFLVDTVVADDNIVLFPDFNNSVQNVFIRRSSVKNNIVFAAALWGLGFNGKNIPALLQHWVHTAPFECICQRAVLGKILLIGDGVIHQAHQWSEAL